MTLWQLYPLRVDTQLIQRLRNDDPLDQIPELADPGLKYPDIVRRNVRNSVRILRELGKRTLITEDLIKKIASLPCGRYIVHFLQALRRSNPELVTESNLNQYLTLKNWADFMVVASIGYLRRRNVSQSLTQEYLDRIFRCTQYYNERWSIFLACLFSVGLLIGVHWIFNLSLMVLFGAIAEAVIWPGLFMCSVLVSVLAIIPLFLIDKLTGNVRLQWVLSLAAMLSFMFICGMMTVFAAVLAGWFFSSGLRAYTFIAFWSGPLFYVMHRDLVETRLMRAQRLVEEEGYRPDSEQLFRAGQESAETWKGYFNSYTVPLGHSWTRDGLLGDNDYDCGFADKTIELNLRREGFPTPV